MPKLERRILEWIDAHLSILFFIIITLLGFYLRYIGRVYLSGDMDVFLLSWFEQMEEAGGLRGLKEQIGDYNLLYQTMIALMTYLPLNPMTMYKAVSCIFDYVMAFSAACFLCDVQQKKRFSVFFNAVYTVILFLPTVVLDSAYWGQSDSIYVCVMLFSVYCLYREKHLPAFILLGVSFALKLQTVFVLPFFLAYYFVKKKFSILMFLLSLLSFWGCGIVAYLFGREPLAAFRIYGMQTGEYQSMWNCSRTVWLVFGNEYPDFGGFAIILTLVICGLGFYLLLSGHKKIDSAVSFFEVLSWFVWTCIFFLPSMHERYAYPLDILLILLAFLDKKYIKFAVFSAFLSFMSYAPFLVHANGVGRTDAFLELFVFCYYSYHMIDREKK